MLWQCQFRNFRSVTGTRAGMEPSGIPPEVLQKMEVMLKYPQFEATTMVKEGRVRNGLAHGSAIARTRSLRAW
jgi:hypothetical protein